MNDSHLTRPFQKLTFTGALAACLLLSLSPSTIGAVETQVLRDDTFADFNKGVSTGTELMAEGRLRVGPRAELKEKSNEGVVWNIAVDPYDGSTFYATGHSGKVFRLQANGKLEVWADLQEVQATALAIDPKGGLLIGASPGGKIYRVTTKGKAEIFFETRERYVWDLIFDRNGVLYAATGTGGKIFRIRGERNGEVYYDSDATNVMDLGFDSEGRLLAATQGKGYVLRVSDLNDGYVLYAASQDEVRALTVDQSGTIYAAANSARVSSALDRPTTAGASFGSSLEGRGEVVQIQPSGFVSSFWSVPQGPIHDLLADNSTTSILVAAGQDGKIYRLETTDSSYSVVADVDEPMVISLASSPHGIIFGTANKAVIYELQTSGTLEAGLFASRPLDAKSTVQWGNLMFDGELREDEIRLKTRSGNTPEPTDGTWSRWIEAEPVANQIVKIQSPVAQYLQYRLTLNGAEQGATGFVDSIQVFYVEQNVAPVIKKIDLAKVPGSPMAAQAAALAAAAARIQQGATPPGGDSDAKEASDEAARAANAAARAAQAAVTARATAQARADLTNSQKVNISWSAEDPNGDKLRYNLYYKGEDETVWKLIEENLTTARHQFSTEAIPDGEYRFKLVATDRFDNQDETAATVSMISRVYTVDNSQPSIDNLNAVRVGPNQFEVTATASDKTSIIAAAEYNLDAADEWRTLAPRDGIFDFHQEELRFFISPEEPQPEHTLSIRVYDREGNSRVEKLLLR